MYYAQVSQQTHHPSRTMIVIGYGQVMATPSSVQLQIEVQTKGNHVQGPQQENAAIMNEVIQSLTHLVFQENKFKLLVIQSHHYIISKMANKLLMAMK